MGFICKVTSTNRFSLPVEAGLWYHLPHESKPPSDFQPFHLILYCFFSNKLYSIELLDFFECIQVQLCTKVLCLSDIVNRKVKNDTVIGEAFLLRNIIKFYDRPKYVIMSPIAIVNPTR